MKTETMNYLILIAVTLVTTLTARYDSKPPSSLRKFDNLISFRMNLKF